MGADDEHGDRRDTGPPMRGRGPTDGALRGGTEQALSRIGAGAWGRLAAVAVRAVGGVATVSLAVRLLGTQSYGVVAFLLSAVGILAGLGSVGMAPAVIRSVAFDHASGDRERVEWTGRGAVTISLLSSGAGLAGLALASLLIPEPAQPVSRPLLVAGIGLFLVGVNVANVTSAMSRGLGRIVLTETPQVVDALGKLAAVGLLWALAIASAEAVALGYGVSGVATVGVCVLILGRVMPDSPRVFLPALRSARDLIVRAVPYMVVAAAGLAVFRFDVLVLGMVGSSADVGVYDPTLRIVDRAMTIPLSLMSIQFLPVATVLFASDDRRSFRDLYVTASKLGFAASVPLLVTFVAFPEVILRALYGAGFTARADVVWWVTVGYAAHIAFGLNAPALLATGTRRRLVAVGIASLVVMVGSAVLLIPLFGVLGAAMATASGLVGLNLLTATALWAEARVSPIRRDHVLTIASSLLPILGGLALRSAGVVEGVLSAAGWAVGVWLVWLGILGLSGTLTLGEIRALIGRGAHRAKEGPR